jgi:cytochrome c5
MRYSFYLAGFFLGFFPFSSVYADAKSDYNTTCAACHNLGVAGAPKVGDKEAWKLRIPKGNATLYDNAINGFTGELGTMPPKGGFSSLSDEQVKTIVEYMVSKSL